MEKDAIMKVFRNGLLPVKGFVAMNLFGHLLVRKDSWDRLSTESKSMMIRHEAIHSAQMRELLFVGFYFAYLFEWLFRLLSGKKNPYRGISFEREAYEHEYDPGYLSARRPFAQWRPYEKRERRHPMDTV
jgi:hypothetical protein